MTDAQESRLKELEGKSDITPGEQVVLNALLALDERSEELEAAKAGNPVPPAPDPVAVAQANVDKAQKAVDDAEAALAAPAPTPAPSPTPGPAV